MALPFSLLALFFFLHLSSATHHSPTPKSGPSQDLVHSSCLHASYPSLCLRTLSSFSGPTKTPNDIAQAAVTVSLSRARKVSDYLSQLSAFHNGTKRQQVAVSDCVDQLSDSVDELRQTLSELRNLRSETFLRQMSNAETWVSAALTNEDTCLDGFQDVDGKVKSDVKSKITNVARITSNALYLINRLDDTRGRAAADP